MPLALSMLAGPRVTVAVRFAGQPFVAVLVPAVTFAAMVAAEVFAQYVKLSVVAVEPDLGV